MAAEIVPVRLGLTKGDLYTLWAPSWRDADDEWQAFLGKDEDLYAFESVADLVAFIRADKDNDLADHPQWAAFTAASAHGCDPAEDRQHDLVGVRFVDAEDADARRARRGVAAQCRRRLQTEQADDRVAHAHQAVDPRRLSFQREARERQRVVARARWQSDRERVRKKGAFVQRGNAALRRQCDGAGAFVELCHQAPIITLPAA